MSKESTFPTKNLTRYLPQMKSHGSFAALLNEMLLHPHDCIFVSSLNDIGACIGLQ
jgi:hypothetical protein